MKRASRPGARSGRGREFPGEIAGASLKHGGQDVPHGHAGRIPRRNRRGLIEARLAAGRAAGVPAEFPGEIAGASLKPSMRPARARRKD